MLLVCPARLLFRCTGVLCRTWVLDCTRIFSGTWIFCRTRILGCTRVPGSHLLFRHESLFLPCLHGLVDLWGQRGYVGVKIEVFLRIWIHWLTAKEDGVSEVVHHANGGHKPRCCPARIMEGCISESWDLDVHPIASGIYRRSTDSPSARMTSGAAEFVEELSTSGD